MKPKISKKDLREIYWDLVKDVDGLEKVILIEIHQYSSYEDPKEVTTVSDILNKEAKIHEDIAKNRREVSQIFSIPLKDVPLYINSKNKLVAYVANWRLKNNK